MSRAGTGNHLDVDDMVLRYKSGETIRGIRASLRVSRRRIYQAIASLGLTRKKKSTRQPSKKIRRNSAGYIITQVLPEHFTASGRKADRGSRYAFVLEHRRLMAERLGRPLQLWEVVHHINHIRDDNRIENLELLVHPQLHNSETFAHQYLIRMKARIAELEAENAALRISAGEKASKVGSTALSDRRVQTPSVMIAPDTGTQ